MREQIKLKKEKVITELKTLRAMQHHRSSLQHLPPTSLPQLSQSRMFSLNLNNDLDQQYNLEPSMHHSSTNLSNYQQKCASSLTIRKSSPQNNNNFSKLTNVTSENKLKEAVVFRRIAKLILPKIEPPKVSMIVQ